MSASRSTILAETITTGNAKDSILITLLLIFHITGVSIRPIHLYNRIPILTRTSNPEESHERKKLAKFAGKLLELLHCLQHRFS
jgi:hypothetical protein